MPISEERRLEIEEEELVRARARVRAEALVDAEQHAEARALDEPAPVLTRSPKGDATAGLGGFLGWGVVSVCMLALVVSLLPQSTSTQSTQAPTSNVTLDWAVECRDVVQAPRTADENQRSTECIALSDRLADSLLESGEICPKDSVAGASLLTTIANWAVMNRDRVAGLPLEEGVLLSARNALPCGDLSAAPVAKKAPIKPKAANTVGEPDQRQLEQKNLIWIEQTKDTVRSRLKDPDSAQFSDVFVTPKHVVCGFVNSKNSMGGYSGKQRFVGSGDVVGPYLEEDITSRAEFAKVWKELCRR